jgi:chromosome segregation ATPase
MEIKFELSSSEYKDLTGYCKLNNLNPDLITKKSYLEGFRIEKYGLLSGSGGTVEKEVIKEVIKYVEVPVVEEKEVVRIEYVEVEKPIEVIKEVQVEKIVEVIKEIPVDKVVIKEVIKEIPVETVVTKIEYISDNTQTNELLLKIQQLETQMSKKDKNLDELRHNLDIALDKPPVEIEKIVEVVKEVIVEKESTDNNWKPKLEALQNTVQKLKQDNIDKDKKIREYEKTIEDIQKFNDDKKALFLKGSNLDDKLYR